MTYPLRQPPVFPASKTAKSRARGPAFHCETFVPAILFHRLMDSAAIAAATEVVAQTDLDFMRGQIVEVNGWVHETARITALR